jgi:fatty acid desaturase
MQAYNDMQNKQNATDQSIYEESRRYNMPYHQQDNRPVSFLNYLASYGIFFIPFAGWLIFIVMLFIWAFSNNTPASKKNWARATLIFLGVLMAFMVFYLMYVISTPVFQDMMNGTFDYNNYIQNIK